MLRYLEEKYEMGFSYAGYVPSGAMESEHLTAYSTDNIADYYSNKTLNLNGDYQIIIYGDEIERNKIVPNSRGKG